jgi:glycosyltransferase involved in cell wall biosynthesis
LERYESENAMKPKMLIISPVTPYPVFHGAGSAIFGYLRVLRQDFDILFAGFCPEKLLDQANEGLRLLCSDVFLMAPPELRYVDALDPTPFYFSNLKDERFRQGVRDLYDRHHPEMIQVEYLNMAEYADGLQGVRILRAHVQDWWHFYIGWKQCLSHRERVTKLLGCFDTIIHNRRMMRRFDRILVTHEEEKIHALELCPDSVVEALPFLLMDCEQFTPSPGIATEPIMIFVGFLPHTPNEEGLRWFIEKVYHLVKREEPAARLVVVGSGASNGMKGLMHDHGVEYPGFVEDLRALYAQTRVYVAPIMTGGGIRTKIIEAMAAGMPVVSSTFAPLGIGTTPGVNLLAADDPQEYANHILNLFRDDSLWWRIRDNARRFIEENYSLQANGPAVALRYRQYLTECVKETAA